MSRTLKPEDQLARYRVVGPLGAGGMGEVYRARDQSLERDVALKILPPELVQSEERVRRFVLEARSASSLNHPHIVTIYEIGHDRVRGADRAPEPDSSPLHYIAMELVSGATLSAKIHEQRVELKTLLGWLAQAAEGVAKAHAAGIIHRDLKPGNIMISQDGYAKVLDFGLAKLVERQAGDPELSTARTVTAGEQTSVGAMLGTTGYMAPEQVRGQAVDARADVFAFGCMLYEAATRRRPFDAESSVETLHRILHDAPVPVDQLNPQAPSELRRLIRRCLAKDPDQRPQSMRDLALDLREIVEEYDALSASASSGSRAAPAASTRRRRGGMVVAAVFAAGVLLVAAWLVWQRPWRREEMAIRAITSNPPGLAVLAAAISPEGRRVAYADPSGVYVKTIDTGEIERLGIPAEPEVRTLSWFPDGSKLLLSRRRPDSRSPEETSILVYSIAAGRLRTLWERGGECTISPDGSRIVLGGIAPGDSSYRWWLMGANGDHPRTIRMPLGSSEFFPTWSPDGQRLAFVRFRREDPPVSVITFGLAGGDTTTVARFSGTQIGGGFAPIAWTSDDRIVFGVPEGLSGDANLWDIRVDRRTGRPIGHRRRLTSLQGATIRAVSASADGRHLAFSRWYPNSDVYIADLQDRNRRLTGIQAFTRDVRYDFPMEWSRDGRALLFISNRNGQQDLFLQALDAATPECLVGKQGDASAARFTPDGRSVLFWLDPPGTSIDSSALMRVSADGGPVEALPGGRTAGYSQCRCARSPDTGCVLGTFLHDTLTFYDLDPARGRGAEILRARLVGDRASSAWDLSPDGTRLVMAGPGEEDSVLRVIDLRTKSERVIGVPGWSTFQWIAWDARGEGWFVSSWWTGGRALLRVDRDGRAYLLHNTEAWLGRQCVSPDGRRLAFGEQTFEGNVWIGERPR